MTDTYGMREMLARALDPPRDPVLSKDDKIALREARDEEELQYEVSSQQKGQDVPAAEVDRFPVSDTTGKLYREDLLEVSARDLRPNDVIPGLGVVVGTGNLERGSARSARYVIGARRSRLVNEAPIEILTVKLRGRGPVNVVAGTEFKVWREEIVQ